MITARITILLNEAVLLIGSLNVPPRDYASLRDRVIQLELEQEINTLRAMLLANNFEEQFKQRCHWRATAVEHTISFGEMPASPTNILYWNIAELVFKPQTMGDILSILLPTTSCLEVTFPSTPTTYDRPEIRSHLKNAAPVLQKSPLAKSLIEPPLFESLLHYIISNNLLFQVTDLSDFSLTIHCEFYESLHKNHPGLAQQLYTHNSQIQAIATDIITFRNQGLAPRIAIEQLVKGLTMGGSRITSGHYATSLAEEALKRFFAYFNALPEETKTQLKLLKCHSLSMEDLINTELAKGTCVETSADHLTKILEHNKNHPLLNLPPKMSQADLKKLQGKYLNRQSNKEALDPRKNESALIILPAQLLQRAIVGICPNIYQDLVLLLINFPPSLYDVLWQHLTFVNAIEIFNNLAIVIKSGIFSVEQAKALAKAILKHYSRFNFKQPLLIWAVRTDTLIFVEEVFATYIDKFAALTMTDTNGDTTLHHAVDSPKILNVLLNAIPEERRLSAIKTLGRLQKNILQLNTTVPHRLNTLLKLLPAEHLPDAVAAPDNGGNNLLFHVASHPEALRTVFSSLTDNEQLVATKQANKWGNTILHQETDAAVFKIFLELYPSADRADAVLLRNRKGETVLHLAARHPKVLTIALQVLNKTQKLNALGLQANNGSSVLQYATADCESLRMLLAILPPEQRIAAIKPLDIKEAARWQGISYIDKYVETILTSLPEHQRLEAVKTKNKEGSSLLSFTAPHVESLHDLLIALPKNDRLDAITTVDHNGLSILRRYVLNPANLKVVLLLLPQDSFVPELWTVCTLLHERANVPQGSPVFFNSYQGAKSLLTSFATAPNFEEIKTHLVEFFNKHPNTELARELLRILEPGSATVAEKIEELKQRWGINPANARNDFYQQS